MEAVAFRFVDALFDLDAVPVESQPTGLPVNLLPGPLIFSRRISAPSAAAMADRDWLFNGVPRRPDTAAHGVDDLACVYADFNLSRALRLGGFY
jgi:hypothetical protein